MRNGLRSRLEGELGLPVLPDTAARVMAACRDERSDLDELADLIARDPSLATHVLRIANSAGFAPRMPILSLQQAIGRVGLATVSDVVLSVALRERVFAVPGHQARLRDLWRHSVATACYAKEISQYLRGDLESAFLCGLLHDVGMAITLQVACDLEREGTVEHASDEAMETAMREFHCEFGAKMAQAWQLGPWIDAVIRNHHDPGRARFRPDEIAIIALADALAYWTLEQGRTEEDFVPEPRFEAVHLHEGGLRTMLKKRERVLQMVAALS